MHFFKNSFLLNSAVKIQIFFLNNCSGKLLHPKCTKERYHRSFLSAVAWIPAVTWKVLLILNNISEVICTSLLFCQIVCCCFFNAQTYLHIIYVKTIWFSNNPWIGGHHIWQLFSMFKNWVKLPPFFHRLQIKLNWCLMFAIILKIIKVWS